MHTLRKFLNNEEQSLIDDGQGLRIFPECDKIFPVVDETPLDEMNVVIIGQDPYPGVKQMDWLSPQGLRNDRIHQALFLKP